MGVGEIISFLIVMAFLDASSRGAVVPPISCVQCMSTNQSDCATSALPATPCQPGATGCMTYVGGSPFHRASFVARNCVFGKHRKSICANPFGTEHHLFCVFVCRHDGCNKQPITVTDSV